MIEALEEGARTITHAKHHPKLRAGDNQVGNSTPDVEWIKILGGDEADWVALSGDTNIIDTPLERRVLNDSGVMFFAFDLYFSNAEKYGQALQLVEMWPQIVRQIESTGSGIFIIRTKAKRIELVAEGRNSKGRRM